MKIWWQSAHDLENDRETDDYLNVLTSTLNAVVRHGSEVVVKGLAYSETDLLEKSDWAYLLHATRVPLLAMQAQSEGYDAYCLGCACGMGVTEAKEAVDIPVVGLTEANMHIATMLGRTFAYLAADEGGARRVREQARELGLDRFMVPCRPFSMSHSQRFQAFDNETILLDALEPLAKEAAHNGAGVLLLGDNVMNIVLSKHGIREIGGLPIQEGSSVLVKFTEMLLDLQALGVKRSRVAYPPIEGKDRDWYLMASQHSTWGPWT